MNESFSKSTMVPTILEPSLRRISSARTPAASTRNKASAHRRNIIGRVFQTGGHAASREPGDVPGSALAEASFRIGGRRRPRVPSSRNQRCIRWRVVRAGAAVRPPPSSLLLSLIGSCSFRYAGCWSPRTLQRRPWPGSRPSSYGPRSERRLQASRGRLSQ